MTFRQLLIRWIFVTVLALVAGLWRNKVFSKELLVVSLLSATAVAALAALSPLADLQGLLGLGAAWLRQCLIFTILAAVIAGASLHASIVAGSIYAVGLAIFGLLS